MKSVIEYIQKSLTEFNSALNPTPEPIEIHDNENSLSLEVIINDLVEKNGPFIMFRSRRFETTESLSPYGLRNYQDRFYP